MQKVLRQFPQGHLFVGLIQQCLKNCITDQPSIQQVQQWLEEGRARVEDREFDVDKLSLTQLLASRDQSILAQRKENYTLSQQNEAQKEEIGALKEENYVLKTEKGVLKAENDFLMSEMASLRDMVHTLQDGNIPTFPTLATPTTPPTSAVSLFYVLYIHTMCLCITDAARAGVFTCNLYGAICLLCFGTTALFGAKQNSIHIMKLFTRSKSCLHFYMHGHQDILGRPRKNGR